MTALTDLGLTAEQEVLYRSILRDPLITFEQLAAEHGLDRTSVHATCAGLVELGLLRTQDESERSAFIVLRPAAAIGELIERREDELLGEYRRASRSRYVIDELELLHRQPSESGPVRDDLERLEGMQALHDRLEELSFFTRTSVYSIQPGGPRTSQQLAYDRPLDQRSIRRGLDLRLIHDVSVLNDEMNRAYLRELVMGGAQVRVTSRRMGRMIVIDGQTAVVPADPADLRRGAMLVRQPGLVAGFLDLFHRTWQEAAEVPWQTEDTKQASSVEISPQDSRILQLLASGCTDETSAREVGVSVRHLRRSISRLMRELGANSRFEAGVIAARRGWL